MVKVNHKSRFFGANRNVNSLVPFEGTRVKLGHDEYLVWFEGIFPDKPTVTKAFPGPTHLQFMRVTENNRIDDEILLQDLVNLSGANWRGFNAKSAPVSVFYCHLVPTLCRLSATGTSLPAVRTSDRGFCDAAMTSKSKDIIFLLGAGASAEAEIPPSGQMIDHIEALLSGTGSNPEWQPYATLYNHIKSAIHYAAGLKGQFREGVTYNIETLVNTLYELERNEEHPLYPFIASWNSRLVSLSREEDGDFSRVRDFRRLILKQLKSWVSPDDISLADYFKGLVPLQRGLTFPLRIFSLNYDLCVERLNTLDFRVEKDSAASGQSSLGIGSDLRRATWGLSHPKSICTNSMARSTGSGMRPGT